METEEILKLVLALVVPVAAAISATIPDSKLGILAKIVNLAALNVGKAKNDRDQS